MEDKIRVACKGSVQINFNLTSLALKYSSTPCVIQSYSFERWVSNSNTCVPLPRVLVFSPPLAVPARARQTDPKTTLWLLRFSILRSLQFVLRDQEEVDVLSYQARAGGHRVNSGSGTNAHGSCHFCWKSSCNGDSLVSTFSSYFLET